MALAGNKSLTAPCPGAEPAVDIASSVVVQANLDWHKYADQEDCEITDREYAEIIADAGFASPREELIAFFYSEWCLFLVDGVPAVSYEAMMDELRRRGLPNEQTGS